MKLAEERDFRRFAEAIAPALLPVAGALTGSRAAAEQLVTAVLARLARRWRRVEDDLDRQATHLLYREYLRRGGTGAPLELHTVDPDDHTRRRPGSGTPRCASSTPAHGPC